MRWKILACLFFTSICSVLSESDDQPYLHVMARSSVYNVGEKKAIYCKGLNLPQRIEWLSPSGEVVEGRSAKNTRVFVERPKNENLVQSLVPIIIQSAQIMDSGNWTCKAGEMSETIEVLVGEKVNIEPRVENLEVEEGKSVRMDCFAKGNPAPVVQWYKNMQPIIDDNRKFVMRKREDNFQLEIRNLNHMDTGEYVCKVTQKALSYYTDKTVMLAVQHKPIMINSFTGEHYTSKINTQEVYAILNETKNISCNAIAHPPPTYRWFRRHNDFDDDVIPEEDTIFTNEEGSMLMLRMYNESFLGEYKCAANNTKGMVSTIYHVVLGKKPQPPDFVTLLSANASELMFNVSCYNCTMADEEGVAPRPDDLKILGYSFQFTKYEEGFTGDWTVATEILVDIVDPNDTVFMVGPLPMSTTFHARVRSRNAAGFSDWVDIVPNPATTDFATQHTASVILIFTSLLLIQCY